jgi:hypothetical protein
MTVVSYDAGAITRADRDLYYSADWLLDPAEIAQRIGGTDFVPKSLRNSPAAITAALLYGAELGLGRMQSLARISVIDGRPTLYAETQRALILAAGHDLWIEEATNTRCTIAGRRRGSEMTSRVTWTLDDAKRARLAGKPNYQSYPRQMLLARASSELARAIFADVIGGLPSYEELEYADEDGAAAAPPSTTDGGADQQPTTTRRRRRVGTTANEPAHEDVGKPEPEPEQPNLPSDAALRKMFAAMGEHGIVDRDERLAFTNGVLGRTIASSKELSAADVAAVIEAAEALPTPTANEAAVEQALVDELDAQQVPLADDEPPLPED